MISPTLPPYSSNSSTKVPSLRAPAVLLATWFGAGLSPKAPGTAGSLAALPFAWGILYGYGVEGLLLATLIVFVIGIWAARGYTALSGGEDPGPVVIDEVAGQWLTLCVVPLQWQWFLAGFILFRFFDIIKPWPVGWLDRNIKGATGVMIDDIAAGIYAILVLYAIDYYLGMPA
ncbi:MAG: phosphatidylglycerophosphatase A [Rhodospirillales bacterium]|nr:phosphatidylglycerophosphatase A [Rhodospirillales bacterium]